MNGARSLRAAVVVVSLVSAAACGGGGGSGGGGQPATVDESLARFGIDTTSTPRLADEGTQEALPDTYGPFGAAQTIDKLDELLVVGVQLPAQNAESLATLIWERESQSSPGTFTASASVVPAASAPWAASSGAAPATMRAATVGDVDGDGLEEALVASFTAGDAAVAVRMLEYQIALWSASAPVEVSAATPTGLAAVTGDFDGDGKADLVVAVATATEVQLVFLKYQSGAMALTGRTVTLAPLTASPALEVSLAAGNLDNDRQQELAVVVNERFQIAGADTGVSRYWVFDDEGTGFAPRRQAQRVTANVGDPVGGYADRSALVGSVAIGDIDADAVGELVLGGLTTFDATGTCAYAYLLIALDGLDADLAPLAASYQRNLFPAASVCTDLRLRTLHLLTFDRDGDGGDEIQANQLTFDDFRTSGGTWNPLTGTTDLTLHELFGGTGDVYTGEFSRATSAFAVGDVTRDKRADLILYSQFAAAPAVRIHAIALPPAPSADPEAWREATSLATAAPPAEPQWPILAPANVDRDSLSIQFSQGERRVVFTEPIVIAALAAPPCATNLGQDLDACRTSFGTAKTSTVENEFAWTVTGGLYVGAKFEVGLFVTVFEAEVEASIKASYSRKTTTGYSLTKRVVRTTGSMEDGVIFTSVPYDQYTYKILSHPTPEFVGKEIVISLPRTPIETLVERRFFNDNVPAGSVQIDDSVFSHEIGVPASYPTAAEKNALIADRPDLFNGPIDVGGSGGYCTAEISLGSTLTHDDTYGVEVELAVKVTAGGVMGGFSIGGGVENSLRVTQGSETYYAGGVGDIAPALYNPDTAYSFGLMSYIHHGPIQSFEVVNYWVE